MMLRHSLIIVCLTGSVFTTYDILFSLLMIPLVISSSEYLLALLLISPLVETSVILFPRFTLGSVLTILLFINYLIKKKSIFFNTKLRAALFVYVILSFFQSIFVSLKAEVGFIQLNEILTIIIRLLTAMAIVDITKSSDFDWQKFWKYSSMTILISFILVLLNVYASDVSYNYYNQVDRIGFEGADLNELSISLVILLTYALYSTKGQILNIKGGFLLILCVCVILKTVSLSGTLMLLLLLFLNIIKNARFRQFSFLVLMFAILKSEAILKMLSGTSVAKRIQFLQSGQMTTDVTTGRFEAWEGSLELILDNWVFGIGPSVSMETSLIGVYTEKAMVVHNTLLEFLISFGLFGSVFISFLFIQNLGLVFKASKTWFASSFIIILAGSMTLSWLWKDLIWIIISITIGYVCYEKNFRDSPIAR